MKALTVVTLTYNNLEQLPKTLCSFFSQRLTNVSRIQYIIADDGTEGFCADKIYRSISASACCKFNDIDLLIYSNTVNVGTVKSFNKVIGKSTGDIIIPLSCGDEFYSPDVLKEIVNSFESSRSPIITGYREIVNNGEVIDIFPPQNLVNLFKPGKEPYLLKYIAVRGNIISGANTYYSKKFLEDVGGFDERFRLLEDYPMYLSALRKGYHIEFVEKIFLRHSAGGVSDPTSPSNMFLRKDSELVNEWTLANVDLNFFSRRIFRFLRPKEKNSRFNLINILKFPDCFIYLCVSKALSKIRSFR